MPMPDNLIHVQVVFKQGGSIKIPMSDVYTAKQLIQAIHNSHQPFVYDDTFIDPSEVVAAAIVQWW